ncbi:MAG: YciI family protein [Bacteroidales bacterium]|nr:YciI family protein [Bacteroidales bacterium]
MQFLLSGYDAKDPEATDRRMAVREKHLKNVKELKDSGNFIWGGAILSDTGVMTGSVIVYEFNSREELDIMLESEPYVLGKVWGKIKIDNFKLASI